jgi:hypothetical protein
MADEHFFPGPGEFPTGLGAAPFYGSASSYYAPQGLDAAAAAMQGLGGFAWAADLQLPDSSAAAAAHFDSALSSLVSSPSHNGAGGYYDGADDVAIIGDLIGRLGGICGAAAAAASASNSCYSTPLSSPPRGSAASPAFRGVSCGGYHGGGGAAAALDTPGTGGRLSRVASSKSLGAGAATPGIMGSPEAETRTDMRSGGSAEMREAAAPPPPAKGGGGSARKRKASGKGRATATSSAMVRYARPDRSIKFVSCPSSAGRLAKQLVGETKSMQTTPDTAAANASSKRSKVAAGVGAECKDDDGIDTAGDNAAPAAAAEPDKGYIHVRARRGQATDSHSLAERVRVRRVVPRSFTESQCAHISSR